MRVHRLPLENDVVGSCDSRDILYWQQYAVAYSITIDIDPNTLPHATSTLKLFWILCRNSPFNTPCYVRCLKIRTIKLTWPLTDWNQQQPLTHLQSVYLNTYGVSHFCHNTRAYANNSLVQEINVNPKRTVHGY